METELSQKQQQQLSSYGQPVDCLPVGRSPADSSKDLPDGVSVEGVYVGKEGIRKLEEEQKNKIELPVFPDGIFDWSEEDLKTLVVPEEIIRVKKTVNFKLLQLWNLWGNLRNNKKLIEIVNSNLEMSEEYKKSDEFYLKQLIVNLVDRQGKILNGKTDLTTELFEQTRKETL